VAGIDYKSSTAPVSLRAFNGGLNSKDNPLFLNDNEASDLQNIDFDVSGDLKKRNGYTTLNGSAFNSGATCTSLHFYESASVDLFVGTFGNKVATMDDLDGTWDDATSGLTITAGDNNLFTWRTFNGKAYGTNNVDPPIKVTAATTASLWTSVTGLTDAKWIETFENYMFMANVLVSSNRKITRLYWSALNDAETWDAADFVEIGLDDGQEITGLQRLGDRLVIFKERSIYIGLFTGDADIPFVFKDTQSSVGAISGYSIQEVSNGLVFLAQDGLYFFDGITSTKISDRVSTTIQGFVKNRYMVTSSGFQRESNRYWLSFTASGGSTNNRVLTWDSVNNAFSVYKGHAANAFAVFSVSGEERIYFGDYGGFAYRGDTGTSDNPLASATAIDAYYYTKWFDFGDTMNQKATPNVTLYYEYSAATLNFVYSYDLDTGDQNTQTFPMSAPGSMWDQANWDEAEWGAAGGSFIRRDLDGRGRVMRFKFANSAVDEEFQINGMGLNAHLETQV
jgi:hypothetical protein